MPLAFMQQSLIKVYSSMSLLWPKNSFMYQEMACELILLITRVLRYILQLPGTMFLILKSKA